MAAAPSYIQGRNLFIYANGSPIGCSKTATVELATAMANSTTKCDVDAAGTLWTRNSPEENSWKLMDSGVIPVVGQEGTKKPFLSLAAAFAAQTLLYVQFQNAANLWMGGNAYIASLKAVGAENSDATYDVTFDGTGPLGFLPVS